MENIFFVAPKTNHIPLVDVLDFIVDALAPIDDRPPALAKLEKKTLIGENAHGNLHWRVEALTIEDWKFLDATWSDKGDVKSVTKQLWAPFATAFTVAKIAAGKNAPAWELQATWTRNRYESLNRRSDLRAKHWDAIDEFLKSGGMHALTLDRLPAHTVQPDLVLVASDACMYLKQAGFQVQIPAPSSARPVQRSQAQEEAILVTIFELGYTADKLPPYENGKPNVKTEISQKAAKRHPELFVSHNVFDKAWNRLSKEKKVQYSRHG